MPRREGRACAKHRRESDDVLCRDVRGAGLLCVERESDVPLFETNCFDNWCIKYAPCANVSGVSSERERFWSDVSGLCCEQQRDLEAERRESLSRFIDSKLDRTSPYFCGWPGVSVSCFGI